MTILQDLEQELFEVDSILAQRLYSDYSPYKNDPVGFIEEVLGEILTDDLKEVCESVARHQVTIAQSGNGTGKSWISAQLATWFFLTQDRPQVYGCAAPPEGNLKNILWSEIDDTRDKHPDLFKDCSVRDLFIKRSPREFMAGVTIPTAGTDKTKEARFSGKHAPSLFFVCDEADAIDDAVFAGIDTCLSGGMTRLLCIFNPRQRLGSVYRMVKSGQANVVKLTAFNHPNVIEGRLVISGAVDREKTIRRVAQWSRPLAKSEKKDKRCYRLPDYLVGCVPVDQKGEELEPLKGGTYRITEHQFSHVVLGQYPAQSDNQLISETWIDMARSRYACYEAENGLVAPEYTRCIAGLDVAEHGVDASVMAKRYGNLLLPLFKWEGRMDVLEVADLAADALHEDALSSIQVDGTGVGSGVTPHLQRKNLPAVSVKVASASTEKTELGEFGILRDQLLWSVREWLRTDSAMLPPDAELIEELTVLTYEVVNGKIRVMKTDNFKELLKRSPDSLMSLAMTFHKTGIFAGLDLS